MSIHENISKIQEKMNSAAKSAGREPSEIALCGVSKGADATKLRMAMEVGLTLFGESYVQEFLAKYDELLQTVEDMPTFHFIGHLQSNKVKYIIDKVSLIHSVDRISLAKEIDRQAELHGKVMEVLIEVNIGNESSKSGVPMEEVLPFVTEISKFKHIKVKGLMTIPPFSQKISDEIEFFMNIYNLFIDIRAKKLDNIDMCILSMGMSDDFEYAIEHGSTLIRVGTAIFGERKR